MKKLYSSGWLFSWQSYFLGLPTADEYLKAKLFRILSPWENCLQKSYQLLKKIALIVFCASMPWWLLIIVISSLLILHLHHSLYFVFDHEIFIVEILEKALQKKIDNFYEILVFSFHIFHHFIQSYCQISYLFVPNWKLRLLLPIP